ncbi:MAG: Gfo/Idh/MocA family oxidoreductase [Clostridia bacterium]|nr:Gfo/Idh/MocA family oxidoreductase [Clostridia bacterium]
MADKKKLVVVGYGGMGGWHVGFAQKSDVVELAGIYDIKEERRALAVENGIRAYETLDEVLRDPEVDIVTVATPNDHHKEIAIAALEAGKNVICEKPVCMNSEELEEIIAVANKVGKLFTVHQNRRWDTDKMRIADLYKKGTIGKMLNIESRIHGSRGIPGDWRKVKHEGGGMVLDWGVHLIDQAIMILEDVKIKSIYARLDHVTNTEVDDGCHIVLGFENGVDYTIEVGTSNYINMPRFYARGDKGTAIIVNWNEPMKVVVKRAGEEKDATPIKAESGLTKTMAPRDEDTVDTFEVPMPQSDVHDFYRNFCASIDGRETQIVTHDQMRRVMKVMECTFESANKNQVLKVDI